MKRTVGFDRPVGVKLEGFVTDGRGQPISLLEHLAKPWKLPSGGGQAEVRREAGPDQIELVTDPATSTLDLWLQLRELENMARRGLQDAQLHYLPRRPGGLRSGGEGWTIVPKRRAMARALCDPKEGNGHGKEVYNLGDICATHFGFGFSEVLSEEGILACNLLNLLAPVACEWVHHQYGIASADRNRDWTNFARPERLPAPRWFADRSTFVEYFESIPRLIKPVSSMGQVEYEVDLETPQQIADGLSESSMWWAARILPTSNIVEFRPLPSVPPHLAVELLPSIDRWLSTALAAVGSRRFESIAEATDSGLIPAFNGQPMPEGDSVWHYSWLRY